MAALSYGIEQLVWTKVADRWVPAIVVGVVADKKKKAVAVFTRVLLIDGDAPLPTTNPLLSPLIAKAKKIEVELAKTVDFGKYDFSSILHRDNERKSLSVANDYFLHRNGDIVGVFVPYENLLEGPIVTSRFGFCFNENFKDFRKGDVIITIEGSNINPAGTKSFSEALLSSNVSVTPDKSVFVQVIRMKKIYLSFLTSHLIHGNLLPSAEDIHGNQLSATGRKFPFVVYVADHTMQVYVRTELLGRKECSPDEPEDELATILGLTEEGNQVWIPFQSWPWSLEPVAAPTVVKAQGETPAGRNASKGGPSRSSGSTGKKSGGGNGSSKAGGSDSKKNKKAKRQRGLDNDEELDDVMDSRDSLGSSRRVSRVKSTARKSDDFVAGEDDYMDGVVEDDDGSEDGFLDDGDEDVGDNDLDSMDEYAGREYHSDSDRDLLDEDDYGDDYGFGSGGRRSSGSRKSQSGKKRSRAAHSKATGAKKGSSTYKGGKGKLTPTEAGKVGGGSSSSSAGKSKASTEVLYAAPLSPVYIWEFQVEKVLAMRLKFQKKVKSELANAGGNSSDKQGAVVSLGKVSEDDGDDTEDVVIGRECLIKFKDQSYRALSWEIEADVMLDTSGHTALKNYLQARKRIGEPAEMEDFDIDEIAPPEWTEVDRVVSSKFEEVHFYDQEDTTAVRETMESGETVAGIKDEVGDDQKVDPYAADDGDGDVNCKQELSTESKMDTGEPNLKPVAESNEVTVLVVAAASPKSPQAKTHASSSSTAIADPSKTPRVSMEELFLVKWRGLGYQFCTWEFSQELSIDEEIARLNQFKAMRERIQAEKFRLTGNTSPTIGTGLGRKRGRGDRASAGQLAVVDGKGTKLSLGAAAGGGGMSGSLVDNRSIFLSLQGGKFTQETIPIRGVELRDNQIIGINWLMFQWSQRRSCILADEMGLGKTLQSIAFLQILRHQCNCNKPFLVIVPLSTMRHWQMEVEEHSDANVLVMYGDEKDRDMIRKYEFTQAAKDTLIPHFDIMVTSYEVAKMEIAFLRKFEWDAMVVDEAHRLKNSKNQVRGLLSTLSTDFRLLLTGTPIQNDMHELFSILQFMQPSDFQSKDDFMAKYGEVTTEGQVLEIQGVLQKYMLRREKKDVEATIPKKTETVVDVELTLNQKQYYRALLERNRKFLMRGPMKKQPQLVNILVELRKVCNHPFLVKGAKEIIMEEHYAREAEQAEAALVVGKTIANISSVPSSSSTAATATEGGVDSAKMEVDSTSTAAAASQPSKAAADIEDSDPGLNDPLVYSSGKMVLLHKLLPKLKTEGSKTLIFTQFTSVLDILAEYLVKYGYGYERIDGNVKYMQRSNAIKRFNDEHSNSFVFLLTTRAGGVGINLQAANTVILFDIDWNPQSDLQAISRSHRLGQKKPVSVYRLLTRNTAEANMFQSANKKVGLTNALLRGLNKSKKSKFDRRSVEDELKNGAYMILQEDEKEAEDSYRNFIRDDIDHILQAHSKEVVYVDGGYKDCDDPDAEQEDQEEAEESVFSKVTFVTSKADTGLKLDDADFWEKALPKEFSRIGRIKLLFEDQAIGTLKSSAVHLHRTIQRVLAVAREINYQRQCGEVSDEMEEVLELIGIVVASGLYPEFEEELQGFMQSIAKPKRHRIIRNLNVYSDPAEGDEVGGNHAVEDKGKKGRENDSDDEYVKEEEKHINSSDEEPDPYAVPGGPPRTRAKRRSLKSVAKMMQRVFNVDPTVRLKRPPPPPPHVPRNSAHSGGAAGRGGGEAQGAPGGLSNDATVNSAAAVAAAMQKAAHGESARKIMELMQTAKSTKAQIESVEKNIALNKQRLIEYNINESLTDRQALQASKDRHYRMLEGIILQESLSRKSENDIRREVEKLWYERTSLDQSSKREMEATHSQRIVILTEQLNAQRSTTMLYANDVKSCHQAINEITVRLVGMGVNASYKARLQHDLNKMEENLKALKASLYSLRMEEDALRAKIGAPGKPYYSWKSEPKHYFARSVHRLFFVSHPGVGEQAFLEYVDAKWKTMLEADFQYWQNRADRVNRKIWEAVQMGENLEATLKSMLHADAREAEEELSGGAGAAAAEQADAAGTGSSSIATATNAPRQNLISRLFQEIVEDDARMRELSSRLTGPNDDRLNMVARTRERRDTYFLNSFLTMRRRVIQWLIETANEKEEEGQNRGALMTSATASVSELAVNAATILELKGEGNADGADASVDNEATVGEASIDESAEAGAGAEVAEGKEDDESPSPSTKRPRRVVGEVGEEREDAEEAEGRESSLSGAGEQQEQKQVSAETSSSASEGDQGRGNETAPSPSAVTAAMAAIKAEEAADPAIREAVLKVTKRILRAFKDVGQIRMIPLSPPIGNLDTVVTMNVKMMDLQHIDVKMSDSGYVSISSLCQPHPNMDGIPLSLQEAILYAVNGEKVNDVSQAQELLAVATEHVMLSIGQPFSDPDTAMRFLSQQVEYVLSTRSALDVLLPNDAAIDASSSSAHVVSTSSSAASVTNDHEPASAGDVADETATPDYDGHSREELLAQRAVEVKVPQLTPRAIVNFFLKLQKKKQQQVPNSTGGNAPSPEPQHPQPVIGGDSMVVDEEAQDVDKEVKGKHQGDVPVSSTSAPVAINEDEAPVEGAVTMSMDADKPTDAEASSAHSGMDIVEAPAAAAAAGGGGDEKKDDDETVDPAYFARAVDRAAQVILHAAVRIKEISIDKADISDPQVQLTISVTVKSPSELDIQQLRPGVTTCTSKTMPHPALEGMALFLDNHVLVSVNGINLLEESFEEVQETLGSVSAPYILRVYKNYPSAGAANEAIAATIREILASHVSWRELKEFLLGVTEFFKSSVSTHLQNFKQHYQHQQRDNAEPGPAHQPRSRGWSDYGDPPVGGGDSHGAQRYPHSQQRMGSSEIYGGPPGPRGSHDPRDYGRSSAPYGSAMSSLQSYPNDHPVDNTRFRTHYDGREISYSSGSGGAAGYPPRDYYPPRSHVYPHEQPHRATSHHDQYPSATSLSYGRHPPTDAPYPRGRFDDIPYSGPGYNRGSRGYDSGSHHDSHPYNSGAGGGRGAGPAQYDHRRPTAHEARPLPTVEHGRWPDQRPSGQPQHGLGRPPRSHEHTYRDADGRSSTGYGGHPPSSGVRTDAPHGTGSRCAQSLPLGLSIVGGSFEQRGSEFTSRSASPQLPP